MVPETLGERIAELRSEQRMTQRELAERADISIPFISGIENNKRNVSSEVLLRIADALDTSLDYLMRGENQKRREPKSRNIPAPLAKAADREEWSFTATETLLEAKQMVLARRGSTSGAKAKSIEDMTVKDWIGLYEQLFNSQ